MTHGLEKDRRRSRLNVAMLRLSWLAILATAVTCGPAVGTALADGPAITGLPQVGNTLTLDTTALGSDTTGFTYEWQDCDAAGQNCADVAGDPTVSAYTLQGSDVGHTIEAIVTAPGSDPATTAPIGPVVPSPWVATVAPTITAGTAQQGIILSVSTGSWGTNLTPTSYTYQWQDCDASGQNCANVAANGASSTYTLQASDVGHTIVATVTATDAYGDVSSPASSASTGLVVSNATVTTLVASPKSAQPNQTITLIASVSSSAGAPAPAGAITFENRGVAISGCANVAVSPTGQTVTVFCPASFGSSTSKLTAVFVPGAGSSLQSSTSSAASVTISATTTTTTTTTTAPPPTTTTSTTPATTPTTTSTPTPTPTPSVVPPSQGVLASVGSTMQWTFYYTRSYTQVRELAVSNVPAGATVFVKCHGGGCPFARHSAVLARVKRCGSKTSGMCSTHGGFDLTPGFATRHLTIGTQITVMISRPNWIGKYYAFTVRARRGPRIRIACLAPGGTRPGQGC